jgi:alpha-mannosidase
VVRRQLHTYKISDPATAHFTTHKNLGNTRIAYKPRYTHTLKTLEARKTQVAISDTATHKPQHARGAKIPI